MANYLEPAKQVGSTQVDPYDGQTPGAYWQAQVEAAAKSQEKYIEKAKKVVRRYRDERDALESHRKKFNILWSNVQVLFPSLYGREPKPDVSRRYLDEDKTSRLASMMLERTIEYEVENFEDFPAAMKGAVEDRLLPGRGTTWIRYEPTIVEVVAQGQAQEPAQITDDTQQSPQATPAQRVIAAHSPCDYVFWQDFMHSPARTWEEVWWVGRWVYMTKQEGIERFGEVFRNVPCEQVESEQTWRRGDGKGVRAEMEKKAKVGEIWNKRTGKVCWIAKGYAQALDERDDFLKLDGFFPCPRPLFATTTTGSLIPIPDFCEYQDQASELDELTQRIYMLTKAAKVVGVFNAEYKEVGRMLNEGVDNKLFPVDAWAAFAEKGGLPGAVVLLDVKVIIEILRQLYEAREATKQTIYEVMGLSDILRGASKAQETLGAQQLKANFGSLRMKTSQQDVARYASDLFKLKAQIICRFYPPELIVKMSGVEHTEDGKDPQLMQAAMQLLKSETMREFSIAVESDTLAQIDEAQEKEQATEFTTAVGAYFKNAVPLVEAAPYMAPLVAELLLFNVRRFKVGRSVEASFERAMGEMQQMIQQKMSQPQANPEAQKAQAEAAKEQAIAQREAQQHQADLAAKQQQDAADLQREAGERQQAIAEKQAEQDHAFRLRQVELAKEDAFDRWKVEQETDRAIIVAEINASKDAGVGSDTGANAGVQTGAAKRVSPIKKLIDAQHEHHTAMEGHVAGIAQAHAQVADHVKRLAEEAGAPVQFHRGPDGRVAAVQKGARMIPLVRGPDGRVSGTGTVQ